MATEKFSQFVNGGLVSVGSQLVGLNAGAGATNTIFNFPGTGILDATGATLVSWVPPVAGGAINYLQFQSAATGQPVQIAALGTDATVGISLLTQGAANITLNPQGGAVKVMGTTALQLPGGTTAQRPAGIAGYQRYNSDSGEMEYYDGVIAAWTPLAAAGAGVTNVIGTAGFITSTGGTTPIINIDPTYVGQATITTVGALSSGSLTTGFTPVNVAQGGTGVSNFTSYAVVCAGAPASNMLQNVVTVGTAGQVLTSNGAGALPSWQSPAAGFVTSVTSANANRITIGGTMSAPTVDIASTYVGQASITTVGALASGSLAAGFTPVSVALGGTGDVAFGAYSVVCGGATSTGALQNVASLGLSGQVLTSSGAGALPSWQTPAAGTVTSVATGAGLTGGPITGSGTINLITNDICNGRLTLTSGVPVTTTNVTAATTIYFTPYKGNYISLYYLGVWTLYSFSEMSFAVPAVATQVYDVFMFSNSGTPTLVISTWTNDTTRATALAFQNGVYVLNGSPQYRYLGTFRTIAAGQTEDSTANRYLWNYYNRAWRSMQVIASANWVYATNTIRQANASTTNQLNMVIGVSEDIVRATVNVCLVSGGTNATYGAMIGLDSTTTIAAASTSNYVTLASALIGQSETAIFAGYVGVGKHSLTWLEIAPAAVNVDVVTSASGAYLNSGIQGNILG